MSIIEIDIDTPDGADEWRDDVAGRVLIALLGALVLRMAVRFWGAVEVVDGISTTVWTGVGTALVTAVGIQLLVLAIADVDLGRWGRPIAAATAVCLTIGTMLVLGGSQSAWLPRLNTDVLAFSSFSAELVANGVNPYTRSMEPAHRLPGAGSFWTQRVDGTTVDSLSYPSGAVLAFLPQFLLDPDRTLGLRHTALVATGALGITLAWMLPSRLAAAGPVALLMTRNQWITSGAGVIDGLWVLPTVVGAWLWAADRRLTACIAVGTACAIKQQPWMILPGLAIWTLLEVDGLVETTRTVGRRAAVGAAPFVALNLPFIADAPQAWLEGVVTPLGSGGAALQSIGIGLAAVQQAASGGVLPRSTFVVGVACATALWFFAIGVNWRRLRWAVWVSPAVILWWHSRSLVSYFACIVPLALVALVAAQGQLRGQCLDRWHKGSSPSGGVR